MIQWQWGGAGGVAIICISIKFPRNAKDTAPGITLGELLGIVLNQESTNYSQQANLPSACFGIAHDLRMVFTLLTVVKHTRAHTHKEEWMTETIRLPERLKYLLSSPLQTMFSNLCFKQYNYCKTNDLIWKRFKWPSSLKNKNQVFMFCVTENTLYFNILSLPNSCFSAPIPFRNCKNDFNCYVKAFH